jgi:UDP-N-acetylmuramyl pentapeptide phosphotransferase/UDP-N-acetylglucosamine-1-phosphate transferase
MEQSIVYHFLWLIGERQATGRLLYSIPLHTTGVISLIRQRKESFAKPTGTMIHPWQNSRWQLEIQDFHDTPTRKKVPKMGGAEATVAVATPFLIAVPLLPWALQNKSVWLAPFLVFEL